MIDVIDKSQCCGCSSCAQRCPKGCIMMRQDEEGFLYPQVDSTVCIDCGLCEKACPVLTPSQVHKPLKVYAAKNPNEEVRMESSSGGIFTMLAESVVREEGVVFGARWNERWNVEHSYTETFEGLKVFRGSKYVQSDINGSYQKAEAFLKEGRKVLFSGTPCQIAGLKTFLRKEYDNLLAVEIACHGVPSPLVWRNYLNEVISSKKIGRIDAINFRNKKYGWNGYHFSIDYTSREGITRTMIMPHGDNPFYSGFLNNLYMRPSCFACPAKACASGADITLADFWGIDKLDRALDDNKGYSTLIANTEKGLADIKSTIGNLPEYPYCEIIKFNPALVNSLMKESRSDAFWKSNDGVIKTVERLCGDSPLLKTKKLVYKIMHKARSVK